MRRSMIAIGLVLTACAGAPGATTPSTASHAGPVEGTLLAFPHADAEALLGRGVTLAANGGYVIGEARAPGCEVIVRRTPARYESHREVRTRDLASVGLAYQSIVSLEAKYGTESRARLDIRNHELLEADLRGDCGERVVTRVFVGRGTRRVFSGRDVSGSVGVAAVGGSQGSSSKQETDEIAWDSDQAYAFVVREPTKTASGALAVTVRVPSFVDEGDAVSLTIETPREAHLIVFYVDAAQQIDILWPSNEEPAPRAFPNKPARLPSAAEEAKNIRLVAKLLKPGESEKESLVAYAFADKRDFDMLKPSAGGAGTNAGAYRAELEKKLRDIPASRWARTQVTYTIRPKK